MSRMKSEKEAMRDQRDAEEDLAIIMNQRLVKEVSNTKYFKQAHLLDSKVVKKMKRFDEIQTTFYIRQGRPKKTPKTRSRESLHNENYQHLQRRKKHKAGTSSLPPPPLPCPPPPPCDGEGNDYCPICATLGCFLLGAFVWCLSSVFQFHAHVQTTVSNARSQRCEIQHQGMRCSICWMKRSGLRIDFARRWRRQGRLEKGK